MADQGMRHGWRLRARLHTDRMKKAVVVPRRTLPAAAHRLGRWGPRVEACVEPGVDAANAGKPCNASGKHENARGCMLPGGWEGGE